MDVEKVQRRLRVAQAFGIVVRLFVVACAAFAAWCAWEAKLAAESTRRMVSLQQVVRQAGGVPIKEEIKSDGR